MLRASNLTDLSLSFPSFCRQLKTIVDLQQRLNTGQVRLHVNTSLKDCVRLLLKSGVAETTVGAWCRAVQAGGRPIGIQADRIETPLAPLSGQSLDKLNIFFVAAQNHRDKEADAANSTVLRALAYLLDTYRVSRGLPRILTAADGSYLPGSFGFVQPEASTPAQAPIATQNAGTAGSSSLPPSAPVAAPATPAPVALMAPTKKDLLSKFGPGTGKNLFDLVADYAETHGKLAAMLPGRSRETHTFKDRRDAVFFDATFHRLAGLSDAGWASLPGELRAHIARKQRPTTFMASVSKGKVDIVALPAWTVLRKYVKSYTDFWGVERDLDRFLPVEVADGFWLGVERWSFWPSLEQMAADIAAGQGGSSYDHLSANIRKAAISTGWSLNGPDPLFRWLVLGGRARQELVEANMARAKRLQQLAPEDRVPLLALWRGINDVGRRRGVAEVVEGDILGPVGGLLAAGSSRPFL